MSVKHPLDKSVLHNLSHFLAEWEYAGLSHKGGDRLEIYSRIDNVWFVAVVQLVNDGSNVPVNVVTTVHRIYERKLMSRYRHGDINKRM